MIIVVLDHVFMRAIANNQPISNSDLAQKSQKSVNFQVLIKGSRQWAVGSRETSPIFTKCSRRVGKRYETDEYVSPATPGAKNVFTFSLHLRVLASGT